MNERLPGTARERAACEQANEQSFWREHIAGQQAGLARAQPRIDELHEGGLDPRRFGTLRASRAMHAIGRIRFGGDRGCIDRQRDRGNKLNLAQAIRAVLDEAADARDEFPPRAEAIVVAARRRYAAEKTLFRRSNARGAFDE